MTTVKVLATTFLDKHYSDLKAKMMSKIHDAQFFNLASDGWSNLRMEHLVNFIIMIPNQKPFFFASLETKAQSQTGENVANSLLEVVRDVGSNKVVSVVTDTASNMKSAWRIIEQELPHVFANGCAAHVLNLAIGDICTLSPFQTLLRQCQIVIKFLKNHTAVKFQFNELLEHLLIKRRCLYLPVETRWYSQKKCLDGLFEAQQAIDILMGRHVDVINSVSAKEKVAEFKQILNGK